MTAPIAWLHRRDPQWSALRGALRVAVVVPLDFAIGSQVVGNAQVATFAAFGSFALLLFANFPGSRSSRAVAYAALAVVGVVLISIGTLVAHPDWSAVVAMALVAFAVLFSGVVSSVVNGGTSAALLAFILAVLLPGVRADLPDRLLGWAIACAVAIPVALFVWPPNDDNLLRRRTAALCRALAAMLHLDQPPPGQQDPVVAVAQARRELRAAFRASALRPAAVSTGARLTIRLVDELEWLSAAVIDACADPPDDWPEPGRRLRSASSQVLESCAGALDHDGTGPSASSCLRLDDCIADLDHARADVARSTVRQLVAAATTGQTTGQTTGPATGGTVAGEFERPLYAAHELGYTVGLTGRTVSAIAAADARTWWARATGRGVDLSQLGLLGAAQRVTVGYLDRRSVWLQNSIRGAIGLALAVLLARVVDAQNAFWIGLGALSVLRSNALSTGATVLRALAGTVLGFGVGAVVIIALGTNTAVLWTVFPFVVLIAAFAPAVISFVAGQAAFTVFSIILFNIIAPLGWQVGVLRLEDVVLGCVASLVAGVLFWPRGAVAALGAALADAYGSAAAYLQQAVDDLTVVGGAGPGRGTNGPENRTDDAIAARAAGTRLDDALRQYLAEHGTKHVPLETVTALANGATRLRLAGMAIAALGTDGADGAAAGSDNGSRDEPDDEAGGPSTGLAHDSRLADTAAVLDRRSRAVTGWYTELATNFDGGSGTAPPPIDAGSGESFLDAVLPAVDECADPAHAARAERLLWSGQYLGDVERLRGDLVGPARVVDAARAEPWWRR